MKKTFLTVVLSAMVLTMAARMPLMVYLDLTEDFCTGGCGTEPFGNIQLLQVNSTSRFRSR